MICETALMNLTIYGQVCNYHNTTRAKLIHDEYCNYCTDVTKHCDQHWKINCLETAHHILCKLPYFITLRKYIFKSYDLNADESFRKARHKRGTTHRITFLRKKIKYLTEQQKLTKEIFPQTGLLGQDLTKKKIMLTHLKTVQT